MASAKRVAPSLRCAATRRYAAPGRPKRRERSFLRCGCSGGCRWPGSATPSRPLPGRLRLRTGSGYGAPASRAGPRPSRSSRPARTEHRGLEPCPRVDPRPLGLSRTLEPRPVRSHDGMVKGDQWFGDPNRALGAAKRVRFPAQQAGALFVESGRELYWWHGIPVAVSLGAADRPGAVHGSVLALRAPVLVERVGPLL